MNKPDLEPSYWPDIAAMVDSIENFDPKFEPRHERFARFLRWVLIGKNAEKISAKALERLTENSISDPKRVGQRFMAMLYVIKPELLGGKNAAHLAKKWRRSKRFVSGDAVGFVEEFPAFRPKRLFSKNAKSAMKNR